MEGKWDVSMLMDAQSEQCPWLVGRSFHCTPGREGITMEAAREREGCAVASWLLSLLEAGQGGTLAINLLREA